MMTDTAGDRDDDDVLVRVAGGISHEIFRPTHYHDYHLSDGDETSTGEEVEEEGEGEEEEDMEDTTLVGDLASDQVSKPLMPPRHRRRRHLQPSVRIKQRSSAVSLCQHIFWPLVYLFIFIASLVSFVCLVLYVVDVYTSRLLLQDQKAGPAGGRTDSSATTATDRNLSSVAGCQRVTVEDVWVVGLPKVLTESAFRLVDVNQDGVLDVIMGFATGADMLRQDPLLCDIYFNGTRPCGGGILALDGRSGAILWKHHSHHEIFALNCLQDIDGDGIEDCLGAGRAGLFEVASGRDGHLMWRYNDSSRNDVMNAYTARYVGDVDGDGVFDIVNVHGGDPYGEPGSLTRLAGKVVLFSGRTGDVLNWQEVPDSREAYYSPVLYQRRDGTKYVLFGTGGETHPGSLWVVTLNDLRKGQIQKAVPLYTDPVKGIMTPPALVDLNGDGTEDIVFATFNSAVVALDGETYSTLWNFSHPSAETYATPAPGFYNDDDIPDFLIRMQIGPGFPLYYYSITTVLDGATGKPLLTPYPRDSVGAQASPLTLSVEGAGNDIFLYWISDCLGNEGRTDTYRFVNGTNVHEQSRSDFCRLRFKSKGYSKLLALGKNIPLPGDTVYNSEERFHVERSAWVNTTAEAEEFLRTHPKHRQVYTHWQQWVQRQKDHWKKKDELKKEKQGEMEHGSSSRADYYDRGSEGNLQRMPEGMNAGTGVIYDEREPLQPEYTGSEESEGGGDYNGKDWRGSSSGKGTDYVVDGRVVVGADYTGENDDVALREKIANIVKKLLAEVDDDDPEGDEAASNDVDRAATDQGPQYGFAGPPLTERRTEGRRGPAQINENTPLGDQYSSSIRPLPEGRMEARRGPTEINEKIPLSDRYSSSGRPLPEMKTDARRGPAQINGNRPLHTWYSSSEKPLPERKKNIRRGPAQINGNRPLHNRYSSLGRPLPERKTNRGPAQINRNTPLSDRYSSSGRLLTESRTESRRGPTQINGNTPLGDYSDDGLGHYSNTDNRQYPNHPTLTSDVRHRQSSNEKNVVKSHQREQLSGSSTPRLKDLSNPVRPQNEPEEYYPSDSYDDTEKPAKPEVPAPHHETKEGRGVNRAAEEIHQRELHQKYLESFGRRKRHEEDSGTREKRHVGPHDEGGLQRLISTGTLAPPLLDKSHPDYSHSMDVVFATYWFYPAKTHILLPEDEACIERKMSEEAIRFSPDSKYHGMDHDAYEHAVQHDCLEESGHSMEEGIFESQSTFNPYNMHMGQMTVYRLRLKCHCGDEAELRSKGQRCAQFLPFEEQQWAAYMGSHGDSHWVPKGSHDRRRKSAESSSKS